MSNKNSIIPLDRQIITTKVVTHEFEISNSEKVIYRITGLKVIPVETIIEPIDVKKYLIRKSEKNHLDIEKNLFEGNYFVNILDYSLGEITYAANHLCEEWANLIWNVLTNPSKDFQQEVLLKPEIIEEKLVSLNPEYFTTVDDLKVFLNNLKLSPENFFIPAKFNQIDVLLESINARLSTEIFFFRKKLFTELLIQKVESKFFQHQNREVLFKPKYLFWKRKMIKEIESVQKYIKSPFTFEDFDQFSHYESFENYNPSKELQYDLVSETLYWIAPFKVAKQRFNRAVELFNSKDDYRDCLDNLRLSLELLLKDILNNNKSLENQLPFINQYQQALGISKEIRNTFHRVLDYFSKYNNDKIKHGDKVTSFDEVEFIFGLTMIFIRLLIKPNKELSFKASED